MEILKTIIDPPEKLNSINPSCIKFTICESTLQEVIDNFDITPGTIGSPIPINNIASVNVSGIPEFEPSSEIKIKLDLQNSDNVESIQLEYFRIQNVGKSTSPESKKNQIENFDFWASIFKDIDNNQRVTIPPDNSLFVIPKNDESNLNTITLTVKNTIDESYYFDYSILFSFPSGSSQKKFFFIDPLMKISSGTSCP